MPASACVCRHSYSAHILGKTKGCSFCNCVAFKDPAALAPADDGPPLSEQAARALAALSANPAFKHVPATHLRDIAHRGRRRLFLAGATVTRQGDDSDSLHILVKGRVSIDREIGGGKSLRLAELEPGDIVGEMGVLNGDPRSAHVTAEEDLETWEFSASDLKAVFKEDPDVLLAIMKVINERLKSTEDLIDTSIKVALAQLGDR